ncbi:Tetracycline resistance protein, class C [Rosistilla oblonga]|uniref:Tetracycline resistance protein, class C n=2 Tax=Rosistilla TaxID=2795779 RepID=A0A518IPJ6_9BACT|nr:MULTISPECIES: TCR/Tet family MFS transporter [Rosistilla]QDS86778.1 Tetracycline resistance protein, class C [Rosistilla ulvae]QDV11092.1 Tetracycline resistance protein, class C [Rosistilla oblonga]QDV55013.1 Tetracycline resistance protein, class C [Rosistilla oblonga]
MNKPGQRRQAAISFILITLFIDILGIGIIIPVLPELVKSFVEGSTANASWYVGVIGSVYALMQFIFAPIVGALSDRFGRRPVILCSLFGLGVDFIVQGLATNIGWLFAGRIFAGVMGASISTANAYIADVSTADTRARNFGLVGVAFGMGFIIGPALGGLLGAFDLRLPFFVAAGLALVNWLYGYFILPESLPPERRSSFTLAKANPLGSLQRLRQYPIVAGLAVAIVCTSLAQRGLENVWVLYTGYRFDWNQQTNGLALGLVGLMAMLVQGGLVRPTIKRFGERRTVLIGVTISFIAFLGYGSATQGWMIPCIIIFGGFGGVSGPAMQSLVAGAIDPSEQGKVQGALTSLISLTNVIAPTFFTAGLFSYFISDDAPIHLPGIPFYVGAALIFTALLIIRRVFRRIPETEQVEAGSLAT